jgi:hypothetical protein
MAQAFSLFTPPERLALLFCAWVSRAKGLMIMPWVANQRSTSSLTVVILLSALMVLTEML